MEIEVVQGSILEVAAEAIVNPANSRGEMGGGVAGVIKRAAGQAVEDEAVAQAPIPVGQAVATSGGKTRFTVVIHAPTMTRPAERIPIANVAQATRAALRLADERGVTSLAMPGMGTGVGAVPPDDAARAMVGELLAFTPRRLARVMLVDLQEQMVEAWRRHLAAGRRPSPPDLPDRPDRGRR